MTRKKLIMDNLYIILILIIFVCAAVFYPNKAYFHCDKLQNICTLKRVTFANKIYTKNARLSSLSKPMYSSYYARFRNDDMMYLVDYDKELDDNVFVQFSFTTLHDAKDIGNKFNAYIKSDEQAFEYTDKWQARAFRNIMIFLAFCFLLSLGNLYFNLK